MFSKVKTRPVAIKGIVKSGDDRLIFFPNILTFPCPAKSLIRYLRMQRGEGNAVLLFNYSLVVFI